MSMNKNYQKYVLAPSYRNWKQNFLKYFIQENKAHLVVLKECKVVDYEKTKKIKGAILAFEKNSDLPEELPEGFEDLFFLFENKLAKYVGSDIAGYLHTGRSRNDLDTTVFRMHVRKKLLKIVESMLLLLKELLKKTLETDDKLFLLYTHGQPAQISTFAHYLSAFAFEVIEDLEALFNAYEKVNLCPAGAAAITTSGFNINRERLAELLGFEKPVENSYRAIVSSHWITHPSSAIRHFLEDVGRFVADISHKASNEVGLVDFPDELVQISSIMPQKRNPVILEHIRIFSEMAAGEFANLTNLFRNVPFQDVNEVADAPMRIFDSASEYVDSVVVLLKTIIEGIEVNSERCKELALSSGATTTELADTLVREAKIGFRKAHKIVSAFVRSGKSYDVLKESFEKEIGKTFPFSKKEIQKVLSPKHFVEVRRISGGPSKTGMKKLLEKFESDLTKIRLKYNKLNEKNLEYENLLDMAFKDL
ncbi:argininosuccinate lyase [Kosmotoga sp.]|uniref:argininosuccinate lyase n=1 Tax=Kosmotoga sp. TaxID=1955248 RepID=UPI0025BACA4B|nr:argininosuccinate lyase [Kosmotoga sp.]